MASGNDKFNIATDKVEGMAHDVPPTYDEVNAKTTADLPNQTQQYPAPHSPSEYPPQQPVQFPLQTSGFPQQPPGPYVYKQQVAQASVQQNGVQATNQTMPNDYFGLALMVTVFFCLPIGIVALFKSIQAQRRSAVGDFEGATTYSTAAKRWSIAGYIFGAVTVLILMIVYISI